MISVRHRVAFIYFAGFNGFVHSSFSHFYSPATIQVSSPPPLPKIPIPPISHRVWRAAGGVADYVENTRKIMFHNIMRLVRLSE